MRSVIDLNKRIKMGRIFQNWHLLRLLRFALGLAAVVQGVVSKDLFAGVLGLLLLSTAIFNVSCCGGGDCSTGKCDIRTKSE